MPVPPSPCCLPSIESEPPFIPSPTGPQTPDRAGTAARTSEVGDAPVGYGNRVPSSPRPPIATTKPRNHVLGTSARDDLLHPREREIEGSRRIAHREPLRHHPLPQCLRPELRGASNQLMPLPVSSSASAHAAFTSSLGCGRTATVSSSTSTPSSAAASSPATRYAPQSLWRVRPRRHHPFLISAHRGARP